LNLPNPLAGQADLLADFLQGTAFMATQTETAYHHFTLFVGQFRQPLIDALRQIIILQQLAGIGRAIVSQGIEQGLVRVRTERDVHRGHLTGPNMGGKSTYMRQTALIVLLAHIGSFVPAAACELSLVDRIFTRIGSSDDLAGGRSTFMVEMSETANILHNASDRSLVLMDEVGRGTSTFDGLSLAWSAAEHLAQQRAFTLFATHYFELTVLPESQPVVANVHLSATEHNERIVFLHHVQPGPASQSYGLAVAQLAGVPGAVISRAREHLERLETTSLTQQPPRQQPGLAQVPLQSDLFASAPHPLLDELERLEPDALSPRQALELLYAWKTRI